MSVSKIVLALTLAITGLCEAKFSVRCSDNTDITTTLTPSEDGVRGRYIVEFCTDVNPDDAHWQIDLHYGRKNYTICPTKWNKDFLKHRHSGVEENIYKKLPNCSSVCLSKEMDLLFSACYTVQNYIREHGTFIYFSYHNISNAYTRDMFFHWDVVGLAVNHGEYVNIHLNLKNIPTTDVTLELSKPNPGDSKHVMWTKDITDNCTYEKYEIFCQLRGLNEGYYNITVDASEAPWTRGEFSERWRRFNFEVTLGNSAWRLETESRGGGGAGAVAWAGGALVCAGALALALLLALRCRRAAAARKHVLRDWLDRVDKKGTQDEVQAPAGPILLLYARECAAAEPVVAALKDLLDTVAPEVHDIGSARTLALAAAGGGEWVRALVARPDARVVLLQTPALHALYVPRAVNDNNTVKLEQPLLSRRVWFREGGAGDALVQFALRLLAHEAHHPTHLPYRKFYLATLEGLETDALPYAVPFRRYVLPRHALALARDLAAPAAPASPAPASPASPALQHAVDSLAHAGVGFLDYVRAKPDYLMDELLVLP